MPVCVYVPHGGMSRVTKRTHRKGQADVSSQFSLGHRWQGEQNVRLRLCGGGVLRMCVWGCMLEVCVCGGGGRDEGWGESHEE